jgi:hypothetical protein
MGQLFIQPSGLRRCAMKTLTNNIKSFFLVLPILAGFLLTGLFFLFLGVTLFPVAGIFVGLAIMYLGFCTANHILSAQAEALGVNEAKEKVFEPPSGEPLIQPGLASTPV